MKKILIEKEEKSWECKQLNMFVIDMTIYQKISNVGCTFIKEGLNGGVPLTVDG